MKKVKTITFATAQGPRSYQEDRYFYKPISKYINLDVLLAVMDGHRGSIVSEICKKRIGKLFKLDIANGAESSLANLVADLNKETSQFYEGSTISMAYVSYDKSKVSIAVLGDSPVIVLDNLQNLHVSPDHNVRSNLVERRRAEARGGIYDSGLIFKDINLIGLQMSRALGNVDLGSVISKEPEIYSVRNPVWILVASDGIFDPNHRNQSVLIAEISELAKKNASADDIMNWAKLRKLQDNATAIVWRKN